MFYRKIFLKSLITIFTLSMILFIGFGGLSVAKADDKYSEVVVDASTYSDNSWQIAPTLNGILHPNWGKTSYPVTLSTVSGERAFSFNFYKGGSNVGNYGVGFKNPIKGEDIASITVRIMLHTTPTGEYSWSYPDAGIIQNGMFLFSTTANGYGEPSYFNTDGYCIPQTIAQDTWTDLKITKQSDIDALLSDGYFKGFQFGARHDGAPEVLAYSNSNFIAVSKITVNYASNVTFDYNDGKTQPSTVRYEKGTAIKYEEPFREGYEFVEWQLNGVKWEDSTLLTENITLVAKWKVSNKVYIKFDTNGGTDIDVKWVEKGTKVTRPEDPTKENALFYAWYYNGVKYDFDATVTSSMTLVAKWREQGDTLTALKNDYKTVGSRLEGVNGESAASVNTAQFGCGQPTWETAKDLGDNDANALKMYFHSYGMTRSLNGIKFGKEVDPELARSVTLKLYCHFSSASTYDASLGGVRLYALDANGLTVDSGYMIPTNIKQDTWVDVTLYGDDMLKIADSDGIIRGFQVGLSMHASDNMSFYLGAYSQRMGFLAFDGATVSRKVFITYQGDGFESVVKEGATGAGVEFYAPDVANKTFVCWVDSVTGEEITKDTKIVWDMTLNAKFENKTTIEDGTYYNVNAEGKIGEGGYVYIKNGVADVSDIINESVLYQGFYSDKLVVFYGLGEKTEIEFSKEKYSKVETVKVNVVTNIKDGDFSYTIAKNTKIKEITLERLGFKLVGFKNGDNDFDFNSVIANDVTLTAVWQYDEIKTEYLYANYSGKYSNGADSITLNADKTLTVKQNGQEKTGNYLLLTSGTVVFIINNEETVNTIIGSKICLSNGKCYEKVLIYTVTFDCDNGRELFYQRSEESSGYKIIKPTSPKKDGYYFAGWYLGNEKFSFDDTVREDITLKAKWTTNVSEAEEKPIDSSESSKPRKKKGCGTSFIDTLPEMAVISMLGVFAWYRSAKRKEK